MASISAFFLAVVGLLGQLATHELSVFPALFLRYLAATSSSFSYCDAKRCRRSGISAGSNCCASDRAHLSILPLLLSEPRLAPDRHAALQYRAPVQPHPGPFASWDHVWNAYRCEPRAGISGVALVLNPFGERLDGTVLVALASGFFNSCSQLAFHQMSRHEDNPLKSLFPFYVLLTLCSTLPIPFVWEQSLAAIERIGQLHAVAVVIGLGVFGLLNQSAKSVAYRNVRNPANLGPFLYLSLVAAAIFDWILYGQVPNTETLLGGVLILASALTILFGTLMRHRIATIRSYETLRARSSNRAHRYRSPKGGHTTAHNPSRWTGDRQCRTAGSRLPVARTARRACSRGLLRRRCRSLALESGECSLDGPAPARLFRLEEALDQQPKDILVTKRQWGAFFGTDLDLQLRRRKVSGIVLAGIATSLGVESTARQAFEHGYNVTIAADAMTDLNAEAHARSLDSIFR